MIIPAVTLLATRIPPMQLNFKRSAIYAALILFAATFILSIKFSQTSGFGLYEFLAYLSGITTFFILSNIRFEKKALDKIFDILCIAASVISFAGLIFYMILAPSRIFGTFIGWNMLSVSFPNAFALFLLMTIPITIYKLINSRVESLKLYFIAAALQSTAFILTFSRESWIALMVGAIIICAIYLWKVKSGKMILIFAAKRIAPVFLITILLFYGATMIRGMKYENQSVYKKITFEADEGKTSYTNRIALFTASLKTAASYPLIGEGPGVFQERFRNHQHNLFLKITNDSGIFALMFFAAFLVLIISSVKSNYKNLPQDLKGITITLIASLSLALTQNMVDYNLNFVSNAFLFWSFLGIIASLIFRKKFTFGKTDYGYKNTYIILAVLLSVILLTVSTHEGFYKIDYAQGKSLYEAKKYEDALQKFDSAQGLIFKGDLNYFIAESYLNLAKIKGWKPFGEEGIKFLSELPQNEKTMKTYYLSAEFCLINANEDCLNWTLPNLKNINIYIRKNLDANENLRPTYDYYLALYKAKKYNTLTGSLDETIKFLESYKNAVERNEHLTITTENPAYALKIYELLINFSNESKLDEQKINDLTLAKTGLARAMNREKQKYENLYHQPAYEE